MLCDAFRRLILFGPLETYEYIGFGAIYFADFKLFHRTLNIDRMTCIERSEQHRDRFEFNRPFNCVSLLFGESGNHLPTLDWNSGPKIVWLDYDQHLTASELDDVRTVCTYARPGTVFLATLNAEKGSLMRSGDDESLKPQEQFAKNIYPYTPPARLSNEDMSGEKLGVTYRKVIHDMVEETLARRNAVSRSRNRMRYRQLFFFSYQETPRTARMITVGGILYADSQAQILRKCSFSRLPFYKTGGIPYLIRAPLLTRKEITHLDALLPETNSPGSLSVKGLRPSYVKNYANIYRHYPNYMEVDS